MAWYLILLLAIAGIAAFIVLVSLIIAWVASHIITSPKGINRLTFERAREIQSGLGGVDFDAYDKMDKEPFAITRNGPKGHRGREDGVRLACEFIPAPAPVGKPAKCLIRVHGFSQNRMISVRFLPVFQAMGYSTVIYDQRGFGESGGFCSLGYYEKHDLAAIVAWVRQRLGPDTVIGLHGESLGAITILESLDVLDDIAFAVPDSSCASAYSAVTALTRLPAFPVLSIVNLWFRLRCGFGLKEIRPIDKVAASDVPLLFLHGTKDRQLVCTESEKLFAAAKNPLSRMELFEGSGHCMMHAEHTERYERLVREFVQSAEARAAEKLTAEEARTHEAV